MLWRQCIKDELPIVYYAAMLGFGDVPVGHEEFATLFAGSLYVYQQKNADLPPTRQALSQTGEALLNVLVNETLELQLLGYLGLPALFFAAKHTKPAPLNAQQAANIDYKLEAVVLFKAFWRTRAAELYSASALLRRYAQSVVDCLPRTAPTPARVPRQAPRNARAMRQWEQEGNAVARPGGQWGASFADVRPCVDEQRPLNLADESANDNKMKRAAEVAEHFSAIDSLLLFDTLSRLTGYDAQQLCSDQAEIHVLEPFVSELGDYQSRHAYPPITLPAKAVSGGLPFATLKKSVDLLAVCDSACAQKMDHFKHIYALKFQQDHYDIIRLDYDIASYLDYDLFDFHTDYVFFDEMRRREQLVLNINTPGDRSRLIKPAGDPTAPGLIDFLQKKHRNEIFASLYAADTAYGALDRETLKQILPLYASVNAMMAEQKEGNIDAMLACASAIPAVGRDALRAGWAAVTALKAHRASANPLGEHLPGAASASPLPGKELPPRYLTIRLGHNLLRLRDPVLNVLTSAGCANFAQANALLNMFARPAFGDQNPPAVRADETLSAVGAKHDDFKGEVPSYEVTLPLKVIDRQPNYLLVTLVDTVSNKGVGRQYAIVAHHPVPLTAASGPAAPIPAAAGTLAPAASIPAAGSTLAPAASIPVAGDTLAPAASIPVAGDTLAPAASIPAAGGALAPAASIPAAGSTLAPAASIPAARGALAPAASIPAAGSTLAPAPPVPAAGSVFAPAAPVQAEVSVFAPAPATKRQPVPDRFAASRTLYEGLHPPVTALMLQLEKATLRAAGRTLPPLTHPLTSFMPPPVFIDQRYDTRYLNFCNMVANYPGARQFYLHGLTQSRKSVPSGYDQLKATLPYFTHEVQLARRYAHDLLEQFPSGRALCLGDDGRSCQPIQRYLAQALRTNDRHILHQAGIRLGWHLAKINHYLNQYAHAIHFASRYPAVSSADNAHLALGFAHPADRARRCYIMVDNFITHHFRHVTRAPPHSAPEVRPAGLTQATEAETGSPYELKENTGKTDPDGDEAMQDIQRRLEPVAHRYLDVFRNMQGDASITVEQFIECIKRDRMLRANLIMDDKSFVARIIADLAQARHNLLQQTGPRRVLAGERQAPPAASPTFLRLLYELVLTFDE